LSRVPAAADFIRFVEQGDPMQTERRQFLRAAAAGMLGATVAGCASMKTSSEPKKHTFVLAHGAFFGAWAFQPTIAELSARGHRAVALDLPGHGLNARFPSSYFRRPLDEARFGTEPSPSADITLADNVDAVSKIVEAVMQGGSGPVVLVGHSMSGPTISAVAEKHPQKIARLVYLTAFLTRSGVPSIAYIQSAENKGEKVAAVIKADPNKVGAIRIDQNSNDPVYVRANQEAFAGELDDRAWRAVTNLAVPDAPAQMFVTPVALTAEKWGRVPRAFIRCAWDNAIRPALQERMIGEADAATPRNKTRVVSLEASHAGSFLSSPRRLAAALEEVAA
jgi:pimeloyl-ACP methyl ester carboxylesterase